MSVELVDKNSFYDEKNIKGFFGGYRWLSNYHICPVVFEGDTYPSSENAYQAAKALWCDRSLFWKCTPSEARKYGQGVKLPADWFSRNLGIMEAILFDKFTRNLDLKQKLLETGDKYLEETNWWNDQFWGVCNNKGENNLGKVSMKVRERIRAL
jgi:ribA/ribD-fused uncharacterized protein